MPAWTWRSRTYKSPKTGQQAPVLTAAAVQITRENMQTAPRAGLPWQMDAWNYYDRLGELRYGIGWLANAVSRCTLYVGKMDPRGDGDGNPNPVSDLRLQGLLDSFANGPSGQIQFMHRIATHLSVPGESFVAAWDEQPDMPGREPERCWGSFSREEVEFRPGGMIRVRRDDYTTADIDPDLALFARVWRPHPRRAWEADSQCKAALPVMRVLCAMNAHFLATVDSRLAGAGILAVPESATIAAASPQDAAQQVHDDPFMNDLVEAMVTPISNRDSAAAVVPIVLRMPDAAADKLKHLDLSTAFDSQSVDIENLHLKKLAISLDIPPEIMLGLGDLNHWSAWSLDESAVKLHVRPLLDIITGAITRMWLHPLMKQMGYDTTDVVVAGDTDVLTLRPNRPVEAIQLYGLNAIGLDALRRECGFDQADAPTQEELKFKILMELAATPIGAQIVLPALGVTGLGVPEAVRTTVTERGTLPGGVPVPGTNKTTATPPVPASSTQTRTGAPSAGAPPTASPASASAPAITAGAGARLPVMAADMACRRALEIAGKRLLDRSTRNRLAHMQLAAWDLHTQIRPAVSDLDRLMDGAWELLDAAGVDSATRLKLDSYVRGLLATGERHEPLLLVRALGA